MPYLLIIRGLSGSGKTTIARGLAKQKRLQLIEYDMFFFGLNGHRKFLKSDFAITYETVLDCLKNCMKHKRSCILEGALAPIHKYDEFNFKNVIKLANDNHYTIIPIRLIASEKSCYERMNKRGGRGGIVDKKTFEQLKNKMKKISLNNERIINTEKKTAEEIIKDIKKMIH